MGLVDKIIQSLSGGIFSVGGMINVSAAGIVTERDKFFTQQGVSKMYQVDKIKPVYADDFISVINQKITKVESSLSVKVYYEIENTFVNTRTPAYVSKMNKSAENYLKFKDEYEKLPKELQELGLHHDNGVRRISFTVKDILRKKHRFDSFKDVLKHTRDENGVYFLLSLFITVVYRDIGDMKAYESQVKSIIEQESEHVTEISKHVALTLANFSPSTMNSGTVKASQMLVSEQNLSNLLPYRREGILSSYGVPIAVNVLNKTPFYMDLFSSPSGATIAIVGKAGSGKSFLGFRYVLELSAMHVTSIYIDIKGTEVYSCLSQVMDSIVRIDFSEKSQKIINTMHLSRHIPDYTIDDAIDSTANMLSIFVAIQEKEGNSVDVISTIKTALRSYFNAVGVKDGKLDTYILSESMTYLKILDYIGTQKDADSAESMRTLYEIISRRLGSAFIEYKMRNNDNAIGLDELQRYSVIVFSFDKSNKTQISLIDQVRISMVLTITRRIAKYNKQNQTYTQLIAEEAQQYLPYPLLCEGVSAVASGLRSENLSVTLMMNDIRVLEEPQFSGLRANIANFIIGSSDAKTTDVLRDVFSKPKLAKDVAMINADQGKFYRHFAVHYEMGTSVINTIIKTEVPSHIEEAFATRTVIKEE